MKQEWASRSNETPPLISTLSSLSADSASEKDIEGLKMGVVSKEDDRFGDERDWTIAGWAELRSSGKKLSKWVRPVSLSI